MLPNFVAHYNHLVNIGVPNDSESVKTLIVTLIPVVDWLVSLLSLLRNRIRVIKHIAYCKKLLRH